MQKEVKAYFQILIIIFSTFAISTLNTTSVYAQSKVCCEKTIDGEYCQFTTADKCDSNSNAASISCEQTSYCNIGTCIVEGACISNAARTSCEAQGGKFSNKPSSSIPECQRGCCLTGNQCNYETELKCQLRNSALTNSEFDFRSVGSEQECLSLCEEEQQGCCVNFGSCTTTSESECGISLNPITEQGFYSGKFCSSLSQCSCKSKNNKGCFDGDVYWMDSCGNREQKIEDCNYAAGTVCSPTTLKCESLDCEDTKDYPNNVHDSEIGGPRENGESWCIYESGTGDFIDKPGSRHYRISCINNEEIVEPCRDFREEICVQGTTNGFTEAGCIENNFNTNNNVELDSSKTTVPPGNEFWRGDRVGIGSKYIGNIFGGSTCSVANKQCPVVYVKKNRVSSWKCEQNCECEEQPYIDQMAKLCKAQGDCGADFNILDVYSEAGFKVSGDGKAPKSVSESEKQNWLRKGVYGGLNLLSEEFQKELEEVQLSDIGEKLSLGGTLLGGVGFFANQAGFMSGVGFYKMAAGGFEFFSSAGAAEAGGAVVAEGATTATPLIGIGVAFTVAVVVIAIIGFLMSGGKTKIKYVNTTCNPWVAPSGGNNCEECDNFESCTEYKCKSLGQSCTFIPENEGTGRTSCVNQDPNDVNSPIITAWKENITKGYTINDLSYGFELIPSVEPYQRINLAIQTNEPSQCKISTEAGVDYDTILDFFGDSFFDINHNMILASLPGDFNKFYIKCQDAVGNKNNRDFTVQYSVKPGPDLTAPRIEGSNPENFDSVQHNIDNLPFTLYLNEPSECKYSLNDLEYNLMPKEFSCDEESDNNLFNCFALLEMKSGDNEFFIRCKDKSDNVNVESYLLNLKRSTELNITLKEPSGELYFNDAVLKVVTSGGAENGKALCNFGINNADILFLNTNSNVHTQPLTLDFGNYDYKISCSDKSGNVISDDLQFSITKDINAPKIFRIFKQGNDLVLIFNEESTCEYGFSSFNFGSGQLINQNSKIQKFNFDEDSLYYINCQDQFGNPMKELRIAP